VASAVLIVLFSVASNCYAQQNGKAQVPEAEQVSKRHIAAIKTDHPPVIDGDLSDPCWKLAATAEKFYDAQNATLVGDQTTVYLLYDEKYIYVAFNCLDSHPEGIVARETVRDTKFQQTNGNPNNEDNVEVDFDPFLTHIGADISQFSVNALSTRSAALAGGRGTKAEWKGDWDAASKRTATGWTCEMRIPWASLNYPTGQAAISMGIDFHRFQDRTKLWSMWSDVTTQFFIDREGIWDGVHVPASAFRPKLSVLPYLLSGIQSNQLSSKIGVDARYTLTPQLTAVGSYNPDFSTVQGAVQSIQYSHAEHSVQEQRPFFLEGGNYFSDQTNINDIGSFFYPIRIQTFDVGAKVYGKADPRDTIGLLDAASLNGRNDFVGRFEHSFNETQSGGAMVVQTTGSGINNTLTALDDHNRWGKLALEGIVANSSGAGAGGGANIFSTYYADKFLTSMVQFTGVSNNFQVPDGFVPYTGFKGFTGVEDWSVSWHHGLLRSSEVTLVPIAWWLPSGGQYFRGIQSSYSVETRTDWRLEFDYVHMSFLDTTDSTIGLNLIRGATNRFCQFGLQIMTGELGSVPATSFTPFANLRVFKKLDLSYQGLLQNRLGLTQQHVITANYELSPTKSFGGRAVFQNADTNAYLFFHNSGGKGTEFYLILGDPNAMRTVRSIQVKLVFSLG
jgi:hypothetical protein